MTRPIRGWVGDLGFGWGGGLGGVGDPDGVWVLWFGGGVVVFLVVFCEICCAVMVMRVPWCVARIVLQCNRYRNVIDGEVVSDALRMQASSDRCIPLRSNESGDIEVCSGPCFVECGGVA